MNRLLCVLVALPFLGCSPVDDDDSALPDSPFSAVVLHGPFSGDATLSALDSDGGGLDVTPVGLAGTDWALGSGIGDFWLIGRLGTDVVRRYDWPATNAPTLEFATGTPTNPQVALECADRIFVTRYGLAVNGGGGDVGIFGLDGSTQGRVDLSDFAEGDDGTPEPSTMVERDGVLYVGLQRFDRNNGWVADPVGKVVAIDCATEQITGSWDTSGNVSVFALGDDIFARGEDGVARFDGATFVATGITDQLTDTVTGVVAGQENWLVVSEAASGQNTLWCIDPATANPTELESPATRAWSFTRDPAGLAWVGWRDHWATPEVEQGTLSIYDMQACTLERRVELPSDPFDVAFTGIQ